LLPVNRLKAAGQLASTLPFLGLALGLPVQKWMVRSQFAQWLPRHSEALWAIAIASIVIVVLGIRSLSADYLIRVSAIMHGRASRGRPTRRSRTGELVARFIGGQPARAGFAFVCRMTRRDFQFRRQVVVFVLFTLIETARMLAQGWRMDPFSGRFTPVHLLPHILGFWLAAVCGVMAFGADFKGAWIFLLVPAQAFSGFARGIWAALWLQVIALPHMILLCFLAWAWGIPHAALFIAYSISVASTYLALELRLIEGVPFASQMDPTRGAVQGPMMMLAGIAGAIAVGLQYFFVFRSPLLVAMATALAAVAAYYLTRSSINALEASIRFHLGILSSESGTLYREINI